MTRSFFEWELPDGISIEQSFPTSVDNYGRTTWHCRYTAVCATCGARSAARQTRADAIDEVEALCAERHLASAAS